MISITANNTIPAWLTATIGQPCGDDFIDVMSTMGDGTMTAAMHKMTNNARERVTWLELQARMIKALITYCNAPNMGLRMIAFSRVCDNVNRMIAYGFKPYDIQSKCFEMVDFDVSLPDLDVSIHDFIAPPND